MPEQAWWIWPLLLYTFGVLAAIDALWQGRTSQGTIAWVLGLLLMPLVTLPLYAFFGSRRFHGYLRARRHGDHSLSFIADQVQAGLEHFALPLVTLHALFILFSACHKLPAISAGY